MNILANPASGSSQSRHEQLLCRHLGRKVEEWASIAGRNAPLQLLDLPVDILETIISQVAHTNDLTSLALTHSALHALVIPHVYSKFDIVWPDPNPQDDVRVGVDALTYGLSTLVKAYDVFGENSRRRYCGQCGKLESRCEHNPRSPRARTTRRGNNFAEYTRKFCLGNGPADWVSDYAITKECGKMLGTLIALAVGRMRNLEEFHFDMPTGVLRDVWLALASLADREDGEQCRLNEVWVRWHDNSFEPGLPGSTIPQAPAPTLLQSSNVSTGHAGITSNASLFYIPDYPRVEFPTFSVLHPLKSLTVLDIDELSYAEEMSVLIETSMEKLRVLRVGVAQHAISDPWVNPGEDRNPASSAASTSRDQISRPGGILGILVARICALSPSTADSNELDGTPQAESIAVELENKPPASIAGSASTNKVTMSIHLQPILTAATPGSDNNTLENDLDEALRSSDVGQLTNIFQNYDIQERPNQLSGPAENQQSSESLTVPVFSNSETPKRQAPDFSADMKDKVPSSRKLQLECLGLERIPISIDVLSKAIDWSRMSDLTILGCGNHEKLWRVLRRTYAPPSHSRNSSLSLKTSTQNPPFLARPSLSTPKPVPFPRSSYTLQIRHIHTDCVSSSLLNFIHTALAPDTLTSLFLQANTTYKSTITISQIHKLTIQRHRGSLRKLLVDSSIRPLHVDPENANAVDLADLTHHTWAFTRELLTTILSGKMHLRELSMNLGQRDWHFFLQNLPLAKELRSLHILRVIPEGARSLAHNGRRTDTFDPKEMAMQVIDIVSLRPQMELCYLGMGPKTCFEVLEHESIPGKKRRGSSFVSSGGDSLGDGDDVDEESDEGGDAYATSAVQAENGDDSDGEIVVLMEPDTTTDEDESRGQGHLKREKKKVKTFKLRDSLFYEDRITIFKARHGKL